MFMLTFYLISFLIFITLPHCTHRLPFPPFPLCTHTNHAHSHSTHTHTLRLPRRVSSSCHIVIDIDIAQTTYGHTGPHTHTLPHCHTATYNTGPHTATPATLPHATLQLKSPKLTKQNCVRMDKLVNCQCCHARRAPRSSCRWRRRKWSISLPQTLRLSLSTPIE